MENKKPTLKQWLQFSAGFIIFLALIAWSGTSDRTEYIISHMSYEVEKAVRANIGDDASDYDVAREYIAHKDEYDAVCYR